MTTEEKRKEYNLMRVLLKDECGIYCVNCGASENLEYHHIVPLACGGNNVFTNIVPLCAECHDKAHGLRKIRKEHANYKGRTRKEAPLDYKHILSRYIKGEFTSKEARKMLGLSKNARVSEQWYYKEYLKEQKIVKTERIRGARGSVLTTVWYEDGSIMYYIDGEIDKMSECLHASLLK